MSDDVTKDGHVLLAVGCDSVFLSRTPPAHGFDSIAALRRAESVFGELIELYAVAEEFVQLFVDIQRSPAQAVHRRISAKNFEIKTIPVESDDVSEGLQLGDQLFRVRLEPAAEVILFVPRNGDRHTESRDIRPATWDLVRQAQRFNIEVDLAIE
jgi:hypothetical protein